MKLSFPLVINLFLGGFQEKKKKKEKGKKKEREKPCVLQPCERVFLLNEPSALEPAYQMKEFIFLTVPRVDIEKMSYQTL